MLGILQMLGSCKCYEGCESCESCKRDVANVANVVNVEKVAKVAKSCESCKSCESQEMSGNCDKKQRPEWNWKNHFMMKYSKLWN